MARGTRGGLSKAAFFFLNAHGLDSCLLDPSAASFDKYSVSFFSETWLTESKSSSRISGKDFFHVPARKPPGRGRPSGGLHLYSTPSLKATLLSSTDHHIAVQLPSLSFIGFYFQPGMDFDDIILDISLALSKCSPYLPVLLGGDLNLKPWEPSFRFLKSFLSTSYDMSILSDLSKATYKARINSSRLDYSFASRSLSSSSESVLEAVCSDHFPLRVTAKLPRSRRSSSPASVSNTFRSALDIDRCSSLLQDPAFLSLADEDLPQVLDLIFSSCSRSSSAEQRRTSRRPWFGELAHDLRRRCLALLVLSRQDPAFNQDFLLARAAYQRHLRAAKKIYANQQTANLIAQARREGIRCLFPAAKSKSTGAPAIPLHELAAYSSRLLSAPTPPPPPVPIPSCSPEIHSLLLPFSVQETSSVLLQLRSKAKSSSSSASPHSLKLLTADIAPVLTRVFNLCLSSSSFPVSWSESVLFFLHKKGCRSNPTNYRTICVENPFLKAFMSLLSARFYRFAESNSLLPDSQFGFRRDRSCLSAASILHDLVFSRFHCKKATYACFIDFLKAFDSVNRSLLYQKLQLLGFPFKVCLLLSNIYSSLQIRVKSDIYLSSPFTTSLGTPQGDPLSPLLFSLFISDLPDSLPSFDFPIPTLLFADDTVLLADSAENLQLSIDALSRYCVENCLSINVSKTKCLVFHRGRLPACSFSVGGSPLEIVNSFTYLGFTFTVQLSFTSHLSSMITKANSRIGLLFQKLPLSHLPLALVLDTFNCFILSIFRYGLHLWLSKVSKASLSSLDSLFTKFLKRYLGLPYFTNNAVIHHLTNTIPLSHTLIKLAHSSPLKANFPRSFSGTRFSFMTSLPDPPSDYSPISLIPSTFWLSPVISPDHLPTDPKIRRSFLSSVLGTLVTIPPWSAK